MCRHQELVRRDDRHPLQERLANPRIGRLNAANDFDDHVWPCGQYIVERFGPYHALRQPLDALPRDVTIEHMSQLHPLVQRRALGQNSGDRQADSPEPEQRHPQGRPQCRGPSLGLLLVN